MFAQVDTLERHASMRKESAECVLEPLPQSETVPCDRFKHACASYNGYVYMHGGRQDYSLGDFWRYSIALNQWERLPCLAGAPDKLEGHSMVAQDGVLYVFGGMMDSGSNSEVTPLWTYVIDSRKWYAARMLDAKDTRPRNRKGHSAVVYQSCMYIYGGYFDITGAVEDFWVFYFDLKKWATLSTSTRGLGPGPRHGHSCVTYNAAMYLFGGLKHMTEQNDFWRFDFRRHNWASIRTSSGPPKLVGHSSIIHSGSLWIIGGGLPYRSPTSNLWKYLFNSRTWKKVSTGKASSPHAKMYHAVIGVGDNFNQGCGGSQIKLPAEETKLPSDRPFSFNTWGVNKVASMSTGNLIEMDTMKTSPATPVFCACSLSSNEERLLSNYDNDAFTGDIDEKEEDLQTPNIKEGSQDVCLMIGGKPLSVGCTVSVWQLKLG
ncbi:leucine-zipper-like transcriptional regulator 1 homolog [Pelodytes ibericus]